MIPLRSASRGQLRLRFLCCVMAVGIVFVGLALRLAYLQVLRGARYRYLSENNRVRIERLVPPRGMILDRRGELLADVRASFDAVVVPAEVPSDREEEVYRYVVEVLGVPLEEILETVHGPGPPRWKPRILKRRLEREEMARLEVHRFELPGVRVQAVPVRHYPFGELMGNTLGYVGEISSEELRLPPYAEYYAGDSLGRSGLEWAWEGELRGEPGGQQVEVDVRGRRLEVLAEQRPHPGHNVVLTVDQRLQEAAERAFGDQVGSAAVLDVLTGDVLALVSEPSLDSNMMARGVTSEEWAALVEDPRHPMQNRSIQGQYPPGSTFKIATALAGLAEGVITSRTEVYCPGFLQFAGRAYRCWKLSGHGWMNLEDAITQSCDVYFYQLGLDVGVDAIHRWSRELGLGAPTGVDLPGEKAGLIPSKAWKRGARGEPWYAGETLSVAIGQGYVLATPLQLASFVAGVAHPQGVRMRPRIVSHIEDAQGRPLQEIPAREEGRLPFQRLHLDLVRQALRQVVAGERGTARKADVEGFPVAGKTGTAQVVKMPSERGLAEEEIPWEHRDHALFVAYAPADDPEIAVSVVVEHGGHGGSAAAPIAQVIIDSYRALKTEGLSLREAPR